MAETALVEIMVFVGAIMGAFAATMIPYWAKLREDPSLAFEKKFIGTAVVSFVTAVAIGVGLFPVLIAQVDTATASLAGIFAITAAASFGINRAGNMVLSTAAKSEELTSSSKTKNKPEAA